MTERKDYTGFYEANERLAQELRRLLEAGALDGVVGILREGGLRLELESWSPALQQVEFLGPLEPGEGRGEETFAYEAFMAERVEQWLTLPGGRRERVSMPDHICPACGHDEQNFIVETAKTCAACSFQW